MYTRFQAELICESGASIGAQYTYIGLQSSHAFTTSILTASIYTVSKQNLMRVAIPF